MRHLANLGVLAVVWGAVVVSPGPDFVATMHFATTRSRRAALVVVAGIAIGTAIWATGALAGLALLLARASWLLDVLRVGGAVLLAWLGLRAIRHANRPVPAGAASMPARPLRTGLLTDLANPKAALFWSSLFAALQPAHAPGVGAGRLRGRGGRHRRGLVRPGRRRVLAGARRPRLPARQALAGLPHRGRLPRPRRPPRDRVASPAGGSGGAAPGRL